MAEEDQDDSQKTEEPSQRRLQEARDKGQVAQSREVQHWIVILGVALAIFIFASQAASGTARLMLPFLERPETIPFDFDSLRQIFAGIVFGLIKIAVLPLLVLIIAALEKSHAGVYELSGCEEMTTNQFIQLVNQNKAVKLAHTAPWLARMLSRFVKGLSPTFVDILLHHTNSLYDIRTYRDFEVTPTSLTALWSKSGPNKKMPSEHITSRFQDQI